MKCPSWSERIDVAVIAGFSIVSTSCLLPPPPMDSPTPRSADDKCDIHPYLATMPQIFFDFLKMEQTTPQTKRVQMIARAQVVETETPSPDMPLPAGSLGIPRDAANCASGPSHAGNTAGNGRQTWGSPASQEAGIKKAELVVKSSKGVKHT